MFLCHQQNERLCAGWVGCHDMDNMLSVRLAPFFVPGLDLDVLFAYQSPVPLWASGSEAAEHGIRDIDNPSPEALALIEKIGRRINEVRDAEDPDTSGDA